MSKREILCLLFYGAAVFWGLRSPLAASCFFTINNTFRPLHWARAKGFLHPVTFPDNHIVTGILAVSLLLNRWPKRWHAGCLVILCFNIWIWVAYLFAKYPDIAYKDTYGATTYLVPLVFIAAVLRDRRAQKVFLYALAGALGAHLAWAGVHGVLSGRVQDLMGIRGGQLMGRNHFTVAGTACIPLLVFVGRHYEGRYRQWVRRLVLFMACAAVLALLYSGSRGAVIGFAGMLLWFGFFCGRTAKRATVVVVLMALALPFVPEFVWTRLGTIQLSGEQVEGSARERMAAMEVGWQITLDHPLIGVGPDNSVLVAAERGLRSGAGGVETHSIWLKCSAEYGLPMLAFFVILIARLLYRLRRRAAKARAAGDGETEFLAVSLSCAIVGFLATGTFTSQFLSEYLWSIIMLAFAFLAAERAKEAPSSGAVRRAAATPEPVPAGEGRPAPRA